MKYKIILNCLLLLFSTAALAQTGCFDIEPQKSSVHLVQDLTNEFLSFSEKQSLETKLRNYNDSTSTQITIIIVPHVYCEIADAAIRLGDEWGVGQSKQDNGIVILVASEDRKIFIATGYGASIYVTDVMAGRIIDNVIKPNFRNNFYYTGLDKATTMIMELLNGEYQSIPKDIESGEGIPIWVIILFIILLFILLNNRGGGRGKQYHYDRHGRKVYDGNWGRNSGTWGDFNRGGGIFIPPSGGGFGGGFGGGSGGFGGFGGGGFGGGGAGGSW